MALLVCLSVTGPAAGASSDLRLPQPFDRQADIFARYWTWLKAETGAPDDLDLPPIEVRPLPRTVKMAFFYPSEAEPWQDLAIVVSPRAIDRAERGEELIVLAELAHEVTHYVLVLSENNWNRDRTVVMRNAVHHHCDAEFQRLSTGIAEFLWQSYHSHDTSREIDQIARLACWRDGHGIGQVARQ